MEKNKPANREEMRSPVETGAFRKPSHSQIAIPLRRRSSFPTQVEHTRPGTRPLLVLISVSTRPEYCIPFCRTGRLNYTKPWSIALGVFAMVHVVFGILLIFNDIKIENCTKDVLPPAARVQFVRQLCFYRKVTELSVICRFLSTNYGADLAFQSGSHRSSPLEAPVC